MSLDTLAKSDIFFFVTMLAVVLVTCAALVVAYYVVKTLEQGRRALKEVEEHVGDASDELKDILFDLQESRIYRFLFRRKRKRN